MVLTIALGILLGALFLYSIPFIIMAISLVIYGIGYAIAWTIDMAKSWIK